MNRIDRLMGMLTTLQSRRYVLAEFLAEKFSISVRTVYRDIRALSEIGIPVGFESGKGYFIVQGYFLPPVSFTIEEANAFILMSSLSEKFADKSISRHYQSGLNKLKAVLREQDKDHADFLETQIQVYKPSQESESSFLSDIQQAITRKTILQIEYKNNKEEISQRQLEPIGLTFYSGQWHVIAWCHKRKDYRDFKSGRISRLSSTGKPFEKKKHIDLNDYIQSLHE